MQERLCFQRPGPQVEGEAVGAGRAPEHVKVKINVDNAVVVASDAAGELDVTRVYTVMSAQERAGVMKKSIEVFGQH